MLVIHCSIWCSFHMIVVFARLENFWEVSLLWLEYQAWLPLMIHIRVKRWGGVAALTPLTQRWWCASLQESFRCGQFKATLWCRLCDILDSPFIKLVVMEMAGTCDSLFTEKKLILIFVSGQQGDMVSGASRDRGSGLVFCVGVTKLHTESPPAPLLLTLPSGLFVRTVKQNQKQPV